MSGSRLDPLREVLVASLRAAERRASNARVECASARRAYIAARTEHMNALCFGMESSWQIHTGREVTRLVAVADAADLDMRETAADVDRARLALADHDRVRDVVV